MPKNTTPKSTARESPPQNANQLVALQLAKSGLPVFPCKPDKSPLTANGFKASTTDTKQVKAWWTKYPDAMPGLPTGAASGVAVLDIDRKGDKDGFKALKQAGLHKAVKAPYVVDTPSGGQHIYYAHVDGLGCSNTGLPTGVDVRADGGYVIAPGSIAPQGRYAVSGKAKDMTAKPFPAKLIKLVGKRKTTTPQSSEPTQPWKIVKAALKSIPNNGQGVDVSRDWWIKMLAALHHESSGSEKGLRLAHKWSDRLPGADPAETDRVWDSFGKGTSKATGATILHEARDHGWDDPSLVAKFIDLDADTSSKPFFQDMADLLANPAPPREWHVKDWIPAKTVHLMGGDGGTGKSLLALQLAVATGTKAEWLGHEIHKPGVALYYGAEDDQDEIHRRLQEVCEGMDVDPHEYAGCVQWRSAIAEDTVFAVLDQSGRVKPTPLMKRIDSEIADVRPSVVVLDTLANLHALDPNSQEQAKAFVSLLIGICQRHGCTIILLAHPSRSGMATGNGDGFSVGWNNSARSRSYLSASTDNPAIKILTSKKANYGPTGLQIKMEWQNGIFRQVNDEYADASVAQSVFLEILDRLTSEGRFYGAVPAANYAPARFAEEPEAHDASLTKAQMATAMKAMLKAGILTIEDYETEDRKSRKRLARGEFDLRQCDFEDLDSDRKDRNGD